MRSPADVHCVDPEPPGYCVGGTTFVPLQATDIEKAITLLPIIVQIGAWGSRWVPDAKELDARSRKMIREIQEGPRAWAQRMDELRAQHLR
jgi:hypothetical protein